MVHKPLAIMYPHHARSLFLVAALTILPAPARGQATSPEPLIRKNDLAWLGAATAISIGVMQFDSRIARSFAGRAARDNSTLNGIADGYSLINEKSLFAAGVVAYAGTRIAGTRSAADIALHTTEAILVSSTLGTVVRGTLGRSRPFVTGGTDAFDYHPGQGFSELKYRAFPSIHTSAAFSTAAALASEMNRRGVRGARATGPILYALAAGPGLARMYADKHWASDVVMGAALGTLTGLKVVRYAHGHPGNRVDRWLLGATSASVDRGGATVAMSLRF